MSVTELAIPTPDGCLLAGDLSLPTGPARAAAVVCHPHPQYGGDRFNSAVDAVFKAFPRAGIAALRFDFRGVNESTGSFGNGVGEVLDCEAAIKVLSEKVPGVPIFAVGYSFGSVVALDSDSAGLAGWVALAPPLTGQKTPKAASDPRPKLLLSPERDQFAPAAKVRGLVGGWAACEAEEVPGADHFLGGRTAWAADRALAFVDRVLQSR
ncbi:Alpha/Beta hydrolase protein [Hyaloraphidium curvatum]|nr:Alpha/Beta hydrolase protein [Hyaloraphidium curvatum]